MKPTIGRIVLYTLTEQDAAEINRRRTTNAQMAARIQEATWIMGAQAHIGNEVQAGGTCPMMITQVWSDGCVNGQAFLDGNDTFWVTSATEGEGERCWNWPPRV